MFSTTCPLCEVTINSLSIPLLKHIVYHCNGRCESLRETVKGLVDLSKAAKVDPDLLVKMELESHLKEWTRKEDPAYTRLCKRNDLKYDKLPKDFYEKYLAAPVTKPGGCVSISQCSTFSKV